MQRDEATLLDMLRAGHLALEFRGDLSKEEFLEDLKTQSSVLHQLQIIGEAVEGGEVLAGGGAGGLDLDHGQVGAVLQDQVDLYAALLPVEEHPGSTARNHRTTASSSPVRSSMSPARATPSVPKRSSGTIDEARHRPSTTDPQFPRITEPTLAIRSKWGSYVTTKAPSRAAMAAIQMSFVGIGVPARRRSATISA